MMNRKERRLAEHLARKAAYKASKRATPLAATETSNPVQDSVGIASSPEPEIASVSTDTPRPEISAARLGANRQNAKLSTGPQSEASKAKVALNALKTGLTGRTVLLPFDDAPAYEALLVSYQKEFAPVGPVEKGLVQSLVDTCWRLERIPGLEYAALENGYSQLGQGNPTLVAQTPQPTMELHIRLVNEKFFRNLQLQENRLMRRREREMKELRTLQEIRKVKEEEELKAAAQAALVAEHNQQPFQLSSLGFEFSSDRFASYMARLTPAMKQNLLKEAMPTLAAAA